MHVITQDGILWRTLPCPIPRASGTASKEYAWRAPNHSRTLA
jgi:hypothetical protein